MKKLLCLLFLSLGPLLNAQEKEIDSLRYDYIGWAIDSTLYNENSDYINKLFDLKTFLKSVVIKSNDPEIKKMNNGFARGFRDSFDYGKIIIREVGEEGTYDFFKSYVDEEQKYHLVFRLYVEDGLNYHDYKLDVTNGEPRIVDFYVYLTGENFSQTLRTIYKTAMSANKKNFFGGTTNKFASDLKKISAIKKLRIQGDFERADKIYRTISAESKKNKTFKLIGIIIAGSLNDESRMSKMISDYEKSFPNDPSLYLVSIDGAFVNEEYDRALNLVNKLDEAIGGDDFLNYFRANLYYAKQDLKKAIEYVEIFTSDYSGFMDGYDTALTLYIENGNNKKAIETLDLFVTKFELSKRDLIDSMKENFPNFSKQKMFINWTKIK
ncbi:MAG: hypothetical protein JXR05_14750 [Flavobacteriaceae bacterium]